MRRTHAATLIALLALAATQSTARPDATGVTFIPSQVVAGAFEHGKPLVEVEGYKVHASRREKPGEAEVHTRDTDIIYVLGGSATLVTGGAVAGGREIAPEEIRGTAISGGETRSLTPGDVLIVPAGTPHWFREVSGPLTYYVVKVRS